MAQRIQIREQKRHGFKAPDMKAATTTRVPLGNVKNTLAAPTEGKLPPAPAKQPCKPAPIPVTAKQPCKPAPNPAPPRGNKQQASPENKPATIEDNTPALPVCEPKPCVLFPPPPPAKLPYEDDPQYCSIYAGDILEYLQEMEEMLQPNPRYMAQQEFINIKMRSILIDWLVQVHLRFSMQTETLYLTISIIDRFLATLVIPKKDFQLVGVTAMSIACKYEEIYFPDLARFLDMTDNTYTREEMVGMEAQILKELDYTLGAPTNIFFLRQFARIAEVTTKVYTMAKFLSEMSAADYQMLEYMPSQQAAASLTLAIKLLGRDNVRRKWLQKLQQHSGYNYSERTLRPCLCRLARLVCTAQLSKQQAVIDKYNTRSHYHVSKEPSLSSKVIRDLTASEKSLAPSI